MSTNVDSGFMAGWRLCSSWPTRCQSAGLGLPRRNGWVERSREIRAKRLIREVFRRHKIAPGFDVVVVPKRELLDASLAAIESEYRHNIERSLRRAGNSSARRSCLSQPEASLALLEAISS